MKFKFDFPNKILFVIVLINLLLSHVICKIDVANAPIDTYGLLNQKISLRCESNNPTDIITWLKDGKLLDHQSTILSFYLTTENEGAYQCNISSVVKSEYHLTNSAQVKLAYLHDFKPELIAQEQYVSPGSTILLYCPIPKGLPIPQVLWKSNSSEFDYRFKLDNQFNLRIDDVKRSDTANYWCTVKNIAASHTSPLTTLIVIQRPVFLMLPQHLQVMVSSSVIFPCLVSGDNPMFVQWYKLGSSSTNKNSLALSRSQIGNNCSMVLTNVQLEDKGAYVCQAKNKGGITEIIFKLSVISYPSFIDTPNDVEANLGESVALSCSAAGVPHPTVFWEHDNTYLLADIDTSNERITVYENGTLFIQNLRTIDEGIYACHAVSFVGTAKSLAKISVKIPLNIFAPVISELPRNVTVTEGSTITLTCASLSANCFFNWYKQSLKIIGLSSRNSRTKLLSNGYLEISDAKIQDSAVYTCRVTSYGLYTEKSAILSVKSLTVDYTNQMVDYNSGYVKPIDKLSIEFIGDTYLIMKWTDKNADSSTIYEVELAGQYLNQWKVMGHTKSTKFIVKPLQSNHAYKLVVRSHLVGKLSSIYIHPEVIYTLNQPTIGLDLAFSEFHKALQDIEIFGIKMTSLSSRQVKVSWKVRGKSILKSISGFIIKANPVNIKRCILMDSSSNSVSRNDANLYGFTCLENQHLWKDPARVLNRFDDENLLKDMETKKYQVYRNIKHDEIRSSTVIGGLSPFRCYEVDIETFIDHATAGRVSGRDSITNAVLTFDELPSAPPNLTNVRWVGNHSVELHWNHLELTRANGPIISYQIQLVNLKNKQINTFEVHYNLLRYSIRLSNVVDRHVVYLSAKSCRGSGPRTAPIFIDAAKYPLIDMSLAYSHSQQLTRFRQRPGNRPSEQPFNELPQPWVIGVIAGGAGCCVLLILVLVLLLICRRRRYARMLLNANSNSTNLIANINNHHHHQQHPHQSKLMLASSNTPQPPSNAMMMMIDDNGVCKCINNNNNTITNPSVTSSNNNSHSNDSSTSFTSKFTEQNHKLLSNYETILPFEVGIGSNIDHQRFHSNPANSSTVGNISGYEGEPCASLKSDSLAYASSNIIYKGCQYYNPSSQATTTTKLANTTNLFDMYPDLRNLPPYQQQQLLRDPQFMQGTIIPPPPMYPPPPAPSANNNHNTISSDNNSTSDNVMMLLANTNHHSSSSGLGGGGLGGCGGSHNNTTTSSGSVSACGSSGNQSSSNNTRLSRHHNNNNHSQQFNNNTATTTTTSTGANSTNVPGGGPASSHNSSSSSRSRAFRTNQKKQKSNNSLSNSTHSGSITNHKALSTDSGSLATTAFIQRPSPPPPQIPLPCLPNEHTNLLQQQQYNQQHQNQNSLADNNNNNNQSDVSANDDDEDDVGNDAYNNNISNMNNNNCPINNHTNSNYHDNNSNVDYWGQQSYTPEENDSVRVMYKMPLRRGDESPDYSTDSSYPYSMANHYSSTEPSIFTSPYQSSPAAPFSFQDQPTKF